MSTALPFPLGEGAVRSKGCEPVSPKRVITSCICLVIASAITLPSAPGVRSAETASVSKAGDGLVTCSQSSQTRQEAV